MNIVHYLLVLCILKVEDEILMYFCVEIAPFLDYRFVLMMSRVAFLIPFHPLMVLTGGPLMYDAS